MAKERKALIRVLREYENPTQQNEPFESRNGKLPVFDRKVLKSDDKSDATPSICT